MLVEYTQGKRLFIDSATSAGVVKHLASYVGQGEGEDVISADGSKVAYYYDVPGAKGVKAAYVDVVSTAGGPSKIVSSSSTLAYADAFVDDSHLLVTKPNGAKDNWELRLYDLNTGRSRQLLSGFFYQSVSVGPDKHHIVYDDGNRGVYVLTLGSDYHVVSNVKILSYLICNSKTKDPCIADEIRPLAWSPDGSKLAFVSAPRIGTDDIYVINSNGTGLTRLTTMPAGTLITYAPPSWSPDGSSLAFSSDMNHLAHPAFELFRITVRSKAITRLTSYLHPSPTRLGDRSPVWLP